MTITAGGDKFRAHNVILNFMGQIIPLVIGVIAIPFVIRGLGVERFGILSLAWMLLGYFTIFDLGLGRATTKFISEEMYSGTTERLQALFWTSSILNFLFGCIGGFLGAVLTPLLVHSVFDIPPILMNEARGTFLILAMSLPIVLVSTALRGALEAAQRFDYVNTVVVFSSSLTFLLPVFGILIGLNVQEIVILLVVSKLCTSVAYMILCFKAFPVLRKRITFNFILTRHLLSYGGWISVSNVVNPILVYFDRFMIGSMVSIAAVAYYTAPYEIVTRLWIIPVSLTLTLFPTFSTIGKVPKEELAALYTRSVKFLLLFLGPLVMILILFAGEILHLWLGIDFLEKSKLVFQILAIGVLVNSPGQIPYALLQGLGRPDITAKFHLIELMIYIPLVWFLVKHFGIIGGALSWTVRVMLDSVLLFCASGKIVDYHILQNNGFKNSLVIILFIACIFIPVSLLNTYFITKAILSALILTLFCLTSWRIILDTDEKKMITTSAKHFVSMIKGIR